MLLYTKISLSNRSFQLTFKLSGVVINALIIVVPILSVTSLLIRWYGVFLEVDMPYTAKPLNSGHLCILKYLSIIKRCPLYRGTLIKIVSVGTKHFVCWSRHMRYLKYPQLGGFAVVCADN